MLLFSFVFTVMQITCITKACLFSHTSDTTEGSATCQNE